MTFLKYFLIGIVGTLMVVSYGMALLRGGFNSNAWVEKYNHPAVNLFDYYHYGTAAFQEEQQRIGLENCNILKENECYILTFKDSKPNFGMCYSPKAINPGWAYSRKIIKWERVRGNWFYWESAPSTSTPPAKQ